MMDVILEVSQCACFTEKDSSYYSYNSSADFEIPNKLRNLSTLVKGMESERSSQCVRTLYELCDNRNRHNRIPMVTTHRFNIIASLTKRLRLELQKNPKSSEGLEVTLLLLNNLSIPYDNKIMIMSNPVAPKLIGKLVQIIQRDIPCRLLACICLTNLALLKGSAKKILYYKCTESKSWRESTEDSIETRIEVHDLKSFTPRHVPELESMKEVLEMLTKPTYYSYFSIMNGSVGEEKKFKTPQMLSVSKECLRWACQLCYNLCVCDQNANLISLSKIPQNILNLIEATNYTSTEDWSVDSIENAAMSCIRRFSSYRVIQVTLIDAGAIKILENLVDGNESQDSNLYKVHGTLSNLKNGNTFDSEESSSSTLSV